MGDGERTWLLFVEVVPQLIMCLSHVNECTHRWLSNGTRVCVEAGYVCTPCGSSKYNTTRFFFVRMSTGG